MFIKGIDNHRNVQVKGLSISLVRMHYYFLGLDFIVFACIGLDFCLRLYLEINNDHMVPSKSINEILDGWSLCIFPMETPPCVSLVHLDVFGGTLCYSVFLDSLFIASPCVLSYWSHAALIWKLS
ncbi:unnamed protein product [Absidia cylindrospora]